MTGFPSIYHWRFYFGASLYIFAALLLCETGSERPLEITQGLFSGAIAFIVMATIAWRWKAFGNPNQLQNFIGHMLMFFCLFFFIMRMHVHATAEDITLLGMLSKTAGWIGKVSGLFPPSLADILKSPGLALMFLSICLAVSLRKDWAIGVLCCVFFAAVAFALSREDFGAKLPFLGGLMLFGGALSVQFNDAAKREFWQPIMDALEDGPFVAGDLELRYRVLKRLNRIGRPLTEKEYIATIGRALHSESDDLLVTETAKRVVSQLVHADGLSEVQDTPHGKVLSLSSHLEEAQSDVFSAIANVPVAIFIGIITILWVISPFDLIPDAIPGVGVIDDVVVSIISAKAISALFERRVDHRPRASSILMSGKS